ncbi:MAG: M48 family metallopeptidase [Spirochaetota bacterium]
MKRSHALRIIAVLTVALFGASCASLGGALTGVADIGRALTPGDQRWALALEGVETLGEVVDASNSPFTPEQEYFVGRSVAATILRSYPAYDGVDANLYLNRLGQTLALASDRPQLYHGYTFLILDTDEINAFASPGGHIFISRGMLRLTESEDEVASILAHEIAHVVHRHGLGSIRSARVIGALQDGALDAVDTMTSSQLDELTDVFGATTSEVIDTLVTRGYSGSTEREADGSAVTILARVGYDPYALARVLERMDEAQRAEYAGEREPVGFSKTHPRPQARVRDLNRSDLRDLSPVSVVDTEVANARYRAALGDI